MSIVTYRGVSYDTEMPKDQSVSWHRLVDSKDHVYRGKHYRPSENKEKDNG